MPLPTPPGLSFTAYARHRGVALPTVSKAVKRGRLKACLVYDTDGKAWIGDVKLADAEWERNKNYESLPPGVAEHLKRTEAEVAQGRVPVLSVAPAAPPPRPARAAPRGEDEEIPEVDDTMTLTEASAIEKRWKAKLAQLDFRKKAGELIEAAEVERRLVDVFSACRAKLLGLPTQLRQRFPELTPAIIAGADALVRAALESLSEELSNPEKEE